MPISQAGSLNTTALLVPNVYVNIVPPPLLLNGVPSNVVGLVGTATWGPVNSPQVLSPAQVPSAFGAMQARKYDLGTIAYVVGLQGATAINCVRVTDGTDVAASSIDKDVGAASAVVATGGTSGYAVNDTVTLPVTGGTQATVLKVLTVSAGVILTVSVTTPGNYTTLPTNPVAQASTSGAGVGTPTFTLTFNTDITFSAKYTGTKGNTLTVAIGTGTNSTNAAPTFKATVTMPGMVPEVFDNVGGTGNAVFVNMAAAINNGQSGIRGPSQLITATAGTGTSAPALQTLTLSGGTDGAATITSAVLCGTDGNTGRTGMYALRSSGIGILALADADDTTQWTLQAAFGLSEGCYAILVNPSGITTTTAISNKATAGIDNYGAKMLHGDWVYIADNVNNIPSRLVSPQGVSAGILGNLSPEQSSLNKAAQGIIGTQRTLANQPYSDAELQTLVQAGIDVITNPVPGGNYFGPRVGHNSSSNAVINGDNYTRMTNYIAQTLAAGMGKYVGAVMTKKEMHDAKATIDAFLLNLQNAKQIQAFSTKLDTTNNPQNMTALGYQTADIQVQYLSIVEKFLINLQGGTSVVVQRVGSPQPQ